MKRKRNCEQTYRTHSTEHEIDFINNIGTYCDFSYDGKVNQKQILINYRKALQKRERWGDIDREAVINLLFQKVYCGDLVG